MSSMIPCYDCKSKDGKIDYGDFLPCSWPCCNCGSNKYKKCNIELCKELGKRCDKFEI